MNKGGFRPLSILDIPIILATSMCKKIFLVVIHSDKSIEGNLLIKNWLLSIRVKEG